MPRSDVRPIGEISLLRMCLILAIVDVVFPSTTPRRSVYGDQGQKVAWQVREERFAKREQEGNKESKVARQVRSRGQRFIGAFVDIGQARPLHDDIQTEREHEHVVGS